MINDFTQEVSLFPPNSAPFGFTFGEWTANWWRWLLEQPPDNNPCYDRTGEKSANNQNYPNVWFLAGTFSGSVKRSCIVPASKALLVPVINYGCSFADEPELKTESDLFLRAKSEIDDITEMEASLDGIEFVDLNKYRVRSPIFEVTLPENNVFEGRAGSTRAISDGYWLFFSPLRPGKHILRTFGSCLNGTIRLQTELDLFVSA